MKISDSRREIALKAVSTAYILLFVYAAVSKLADYQSFHRQLAMSPVLTAHASWLAWQVPVWEIVLALLLSFRRTRLAGLLGSLCLMTAFTAYIYLIMNYASHIPCSCGGILEDMGWIQHFYFNLGFVVLATGAFLLEAFFLVASSHASGKRLNFALAGGMLLSAGITVGLFLVSERIVHYENRFHRRYPHPSVAEVAKAKLPHNSYYVAGFSKSRVYLAT